MKSKLQDIIESGVAPGISTGTPAVDHNSVYYKAPRGLAAVENEPKWKNGPTRSAKDISRYMGMSTDFIRKTWQKPVLVALLCFCGAFLRAGDLTSGVSFSDGQTVSAAQMNNIVNNATVNNSLISGKPVDPTPLGSDTWLIYSPTLNGLYRLTLNAGVLQNPALITAQTEKTTPIAGDYLLLWDSVGMGLEKVSAGNLVLNNTNFIFGQPFMQITNLDPQLRLPILNFGTNAQTTASNLFTALLPNTITNWPTITTATNSDLVPIYSTRTGGSQTNVMTLISPQALGPSTYVITNISMLNRPNYTYVTNISSAIPPMVQVVMVVTNLHGFSLEGYTLGQEIPSEVVLNAGNLPAIAVYSATDTVIISTSFATNTLLSIPQSGGTNQGNTYLTESWTNFNLKLYITPRHGL